MLHNNNYKISTPPKKKKNLVKFQSDGEGRLGVSRHAPSTFRGIRLTRESQLVASVKTNDVECPWRGIGSSAVCVSRTEIDWRNFLLLVVKWMLPGTCRDDGMIFTSTPPKSMPDRGQSSSSKDINFFFFLLMSVEQR